jgi:hypothetical protein
MKIEGGLCVADVFVGIRDLQQMKKIAHDVVELLMIALLQGRSS